MTTELNWMGEATKVIYCTCINQRANMETTHNLDNNQTLKTVNYTHKI